MNKTMAIMNTSEMLSCLHGYDEGVRLNRRAEAYNAFAAYREKVAAVPLAHRYAGTEGILSNLRTRFEAAELSLASFRDARRRR